MPIRDYGSSPVETVDSHKLNELQLLQEIVEIARLVFSAAAVSVFLIDRNTGELVFAATSGEGEGHLPGTRFPANTGIAGWVVASAQPLIADDVTGTGQFDLAAAESTGYVPRSIMAAPLIYNGQSVGVLEVLDRGTRQRGDLGDVDLLGLLATQAAQVLEILAQWQWATPAATSVAGGLTLLRAIAGRLDSAGPSSTAAALALLEAANAILDT